MNYVNQKFGEWTVIAKDTKGSHWICRCSCGNEQSLYVSTFKLGRSKRCIECKRSLPSVDRVGERVGTLVVEKYAGRLSGTRGGRAVHHWQCRCDCGELVNVRADHFSETRLMNRTCGCGRSGENNYGWKGHGELSGQRWSSINKSARERNLEVTITIEDAWNLFLKQGRMCALTGWNLTMHVRGSHGGDASLDRIDSSLGYVSGNIQWVHKDINMMKNKHDEYYFIGMCKAVASHRPSVNYNSMYR